MVIIFWSINSLNHPLIEKIQVSSKNLLNSLIYSIKIFSHNIKNEIQPLRKKPLSLLPQQEKLKQFIGEPFISFSDADWEEFWNIIYGYTEITTSYGTITRQRTLEEIQEELIYLYGNPFKYFEKQHWESFWSIIFSKY